METTTLSSKGQLVIPKAIRDAADVFRGSMLEVRYVDGEIRLRAVPSAAATSLEEVAGCLARAGHKRLSDAQTRAIVTARLNARHAR